MTTSGQNSVVDEFDLPFKRLINVSERILSNVAKNQLDIFSSSHARIVNDLKTYVKCYGKTGKDAIEETHADLFHIIFDQFQEEIVRDPISDDWLENGQIAIQYGSNYQLTNREHNINIWLTDIYRLGKEMQRDEQNLPSTSSNLSERVKYPDMFLLCLYQIFNVWKHDQIVNARLDKMINEIEGKLNHRPSGSGSQPPNVDMSGMLSTFAGLFQHMVPPSADGQSAPDIGAILSSIINNPKVSDAIGGIIKSINPNDGIPQIMQKVTGGIGNSEIGGSIGQVLVEAMPQQPPIPTSIRQLEEVDETEEDVPIISDETSLDEGQD